MMTLGSAALAFLIGFVSVGTAIQRQILVSEGRVLGTLVSSSVVSITFFFSAYFVAKDQILNYCFYALGSIVITVVMAWQRQKQPSPEVK